MSDRSLPRARMNKVANLNRPRVTLGPAETVSSQCVYQMWVLLGAPRDAVLEAFACVPLAFERQSWIVSPQGEEYITHRGVDMSGIRWGW